MPMNAFLIKDAQTGETIAERPSSDTAQRFALLRMASHKAPLTILDPQGREVARVDYTPG